MPSQITNYQCPACGGPLHFSPETGKLVCDYCESTYTTEEVEAFYREKDEAAAAAMEAEAEKKEKEKEEAAAQAAAAAEEIPPEYTEGTPQTEEQWDTSHLTDDWGSDSASMRAYSCPSCGAELICDATTAATSCPYCNNPTIIPGQFAGTLKPDYIIPFKYNKEQAIARLKEHYKGKWLLPGVFTSQNHIQEIRGIYVPFWLYDGVAEGTARFNAEKSHVFRRGKEEVTETDHYDVVRSGSLSFEKVPADGARKMPDDHMDSIEPYDYRELKPFSTAFLPGYLADKYDVSAKENIPRIEHRVKESLSNELMRTVKGYNAVHPAGEQIRMVQGKVHYALFPVWMLNTRWNDQDFLFAMNGQTGKMVGDLPVSKGKLAGFFVGFAAAVFALLSIFI
ncbi:MAG: hypothetical protein IJJ25_14115 [Lachnospiraceae bacterium]|nr:hypothetical protein [Lachnospiraceae bacterium]